MSAPTATLWSAFRPGPSAFSYNHWLMGLEILGLGLPGGIELVVRTTPIGEWFAKELDQFGLVKAAAGHAVQSASWPASASAPRRCLL